MPITEPSRRARGIVLAYVPDNSAHASAHERSTLLEVARRLAALKGYAAGGMYDASRPPGGPVYFVPSSTLTREEAGALGIRGADDLFGGVVPLGFVGTKAISHPLVAPDAVALPGWNALFAERVGDAVVSGYTAFSPADACRAGSTLLYDGPVRIKPVRASGGRGQFVARDVAELQRALDRMPPGEIVSHGVVLEEDLSEVRTFSVGQVRVADLLASYFGQQRLTRSNKGEEVFGGSDLTVLRGGFAALVTPELAPELRCAVEQAQRYDAAARACFAGFFASRSNYDIVLGRDAAGRWRSGVLEQSWRVGGATGAEIAALEILRAQPERTRVRAATFEVFGDSPRPPPGATVYFRGTDPRVGRLTKYTVVHPDVDPG